MSLPEWLADPAHYTQCRRCAGRGEIACRACDGRGSVVGPDRYLYGRTIGRRFGLKVCSLCHGSGRWRCGVCSSGSVPKR